MEMLVCAIKIPPIAGPIKRATLKQAEFKEMAFGRSLISSTSKTKVDCLKGLSMAAILFKKRPHTTIDQILIFPVTVKSVIKSACTANKICTINKSFWRLNLSTITPAKGVIMKSGAAVKHIIVPIANGDFVISYTSQAMAIFCIQIPIWDTASPGKNRRKFRYLKARNINFNFCIYIF